MVIKLSFEDLSESELDQVVEQAPGMLLHDEDETPLGVILKAVRVEGTKHIEFEVELGLIQSSTVH